MYILFRDLHWKPSDYYFMDEGEKIIVRAFLAKYSAERSEELERIEKLRRSGK